MISAIVYGRNDNFNYELNRRTTIGLNHLAERLSPESDEIVFVDFNTDNDLPTQPEAISDCLTDRARGLIRVIRVRPSFFSNLTSEGPPVREAICRNIALRRLGQEPQWVLSTNPDCLLLSPSDHSLHDVVKGLAPGYYGLPRFELPRVVWENLPRSKVSEAREMTLKMSQKFHLEERVSHYLPKVGFDSPGDFQLFLYCDAVRLGGFNENMTHGWHIDSNINARLATVYDKCLDLNEVAKTDFKLFHTEHTRRASRKHADGRAENSFDAFVEDLQDSYVEGQENWGGADQDFEEFPLSLPPSRLALDRLGEVLDAQPEPSSYTYGPETHDQIVANPDHTAAFVLDHLAYLPTNTRIGFIGEDADSQVWFQKLMKAAGRSEMAQIIDHKDELAATLPDVDILLIEVRQDAQSKFPSLAQLGFTQWVVLERLRLQCGNDTARTVIAINAPHSLYERAFLSQIDAVLAPVATRLRFGKVKPLSAEPIDLTNGFEATNLSHGESGYIAICRLPSLAPARWRLDYKVKVDFAIGSRVVLDIAINAKQGDTVNLTNKLGFSKTGSIIFETSHDALFGDFECRIWSNQKAKTTIEYATLSPTEH